MNEHERWILEWTKKADSDFKTAKIVFDSGEPIYDSICFHCHQCAEKYLKAYLIHSSTAVTKTHDLEKLLNECIHMAQEFSELHESCFILKDYAGEIRYPDDYVEITREEADKAIDHASFVRDFVRARIGFLNI